MTCAAQCQGCKEMTFPANRLGDQGQRYEVRAEGYPEEGVNVIVWTDDRTAADHMAGDVAQAPSCTQTWVVDRDFTCGECGASCDVGAPDRKDTRCPNCCPDHEFENDDGWAFCVNCGEEAPPDYFEEDPE